MGRHSAADLRARFRELHAAPGVFVQVGSPGLNAAIRLGECSATVHRVRPATLDHIRRISLGGHK